MFVCCPLSQSPDIFLISILPRLNFLTFCLGSSSPENGVSLGLVSVPFYTSDIIFAVRSRKSCRMDIKPPFLQLILYWISNLLPQGQDVGRLLISQPHWSLIEPQNCCLDDSNPNSVIGSTAANLKLQLELIYPQHVFLCHSFLLLIFRWRFCSFLRLTSVSQFWVSLDYIRLYRILNFVVYLK